MPFVDSSEGVRAKSYTSEVNTPILVGVLVAAGVAAVLFAGNLVTAASGVSLSVASSASAASSAPDVAESERGSGSAGPDGGQGDEEKAPVYVFVSGTVASPGVYTLQPGARVGDAIDAAGGFAEGAASDYNNLARVVVDGEQIHVPSQDEAAEEPAVSDAPARATVLQDAATNGLVNINTASEGELESLPGIGPATASKIVASRDADGPFSSVEELMRVSGIGEKKYAALEGLICV